jgi:hypothetical protein
MAVVTLHIIILLVTELILAFKRLRLLQTLASLHVAALTRIKDALVRMAQRAVELVKDFRAGELIKPPISL